MKAVIDRFEGECAVILLGEEEWRISVPGRYLPEGAAEGSWLEVSFKLDREGRKKQEKKIRNLLDKLKNKER